MVPALCVTVCMSRSRFRASSFRRASLARYGVLNHHHLPMRCDWRRCIACVPNNERNASLLVLLMGNGCPNVGSWDDRRRLPRPNSGTEFPQGRRPNVRFGALLLQCWLKTVTISIFFYFMENELSMNNTPVVGIVQGFIRHIFRKRNIL